MMVDKDKMNRCVHLNDTLRVCVIVDIRQIKRDKVLSSPSKGHLDMFDLSVHEGYFRFYRHSWQAIVMRLLLVYGFLHESSERENSDFFHNNGKLFSKNFVPLCRPSIRTDAYAGARVGGRHF